MSLVSWLVWIELWHSAQLCCWCLAWLNVPSPSQRSKITALVIVGVTFGRGGLT